MDEADGGIKRTVFRWPEEARELVKHFLRSSTNVNSHNDSAIASLATRLGIITGNPRDACLRFLHRHGVTKKRSCRPWTKPEQQRLFDLIEVWPVEEVARILQRTPDSIRSMLHRLGGSSKRGRDWFTPYSLAEVLHIRADEVQKWIRNDWLKCRIVETTGVKKRIIDPDEFCNFVKLHGPRVVGRRLNHDGLQFVQNFVFPPKHAHLLPLRKSKDMAGTEIGNGGEEEEVNIAESA